MVCLPTQLEDLLGKCWRIFIDIPYMEQMGCSIQSAMLEYHSVSTISRVALDKAMSKASKNRRWPSETSVRVWFEFIWGWQALAIQVLNLWKTHRLRLVGGFNPSEKYESTGMIIPNIWENHPVMIQSPPTRWSSVTMSSAFFFPRFFPWFLPVPKLAARHPGSDHGAV